MFPSTNRYPCKTVSSKSARLEISTIKDNEYKSIKNHETRAKVLKIEFFFT